MNISFENYLNAKQSALQSVIDEMLRVPGSEDAVHNVIDAMYIEMRLNVQLVWPNKADQFDAQFTDWAINAGALQFEPLYDDSTAYGSHEMCSTPLGYENPQGLVDLDAIFALIEKFA